MLKRALSVLAPLAFLSTTACGGASTPAADDVPSSPVETQEEAEKPDLDPVDEPEADDPSDTPPEDEAPPSEDPPYEPPPKDEEPEDEREEEETTVPPPDETPPPPPPEPEEPAVCGDGQLTGDEVCDGTDLGGLGCMSYGFAPGAVSCDASCGAVTSTCEALAYTAIAAIGAAAVVEGALDETTPTWTRPGASCGAGFSGGYHFFLHGFENTTGEAQRVSVRADFPAGDGFLHAFTVPAVPATLEGCLEGNDDLDDTASSGLTDVAIGPGERLVFAVSTYSAGATLESYTLTVQTLDESSLPDDPAPEPSNCGNGSIDEGEVCDGASVGGLTCNALGFNYGFIGCAASCGGYVSHCFGGSGVPPEDPAEALPPAALPLLNVGLSAQLSGVVDGDSATFSRVNESCQAMVSDGYAFEAHTIRNTHNHSHRVTLTANWAEEDGFLAVFDDDFDPADPAAECLFADDDWANNGLDGSSRLSSRIADIVLGANESVVVVATSYSSSKALGAYTIDVTKESGDDVPVLEIDEDSDAQISISTVHGSDAQFEVDGKTRFFEMHLVHNDDNETLDLDVLGNWHDGDGMLYVYDHDDDAEHGLGELLASNDDAGGLTQSRIGAAEGLSIAPGQTLAIVTTSFGESQSLGSYDLAVSLRE